MIGKPVPAFDLPPLAAGAPGLKSTDLKGHLPADQFLRLLVRPLPGRASAAARSGQGQAHRARRHRLEEQARRRQQLSHRSRQSLRAHGGGSRAGAPASISASMACRRAISSTERQHPLPPGRALHRGRRREKAEAADRGTVEVSLGDEACRMAGLAPPPSNRHGRRRPTIHEFAGQGLGLSAAKQENGTRRTRRDSGGHGGERPLGLHSHFSVPLLLKLRVLRVKLLALTPTRYRIKGWQTRGWSAFADHDGERGGVRRGRREDGDLPRFVLLPLLLSFLLATAAFAVEPSEMLKDPVLEARARSISRELRCLVCQNQSIDEFQRRSRP